MSFVSTNTQICTLQQCVYLLCEGTQSSSERSGKQRSSCRCLSICRAEFSSASAMAAAGLLGPALDGMAKVLFNFPTLSSKTKTKPWGGCTASISVQNK